MAPCVRYPCRVLVVPQRATTHRLALAVAEQLNHRPAHFAHPSPALPMRPIDHNPSSRPRPFLLPAVAARRTCAAPLPRAGPVFDPNRKPAPRRLRFPQAEPPFFGLPASGGRTFDCASAPTERRNEIGSAHVCTPVTNAHLVCC